MCCRLKLRRLKSLSHSALAGLLVLACGSVALGAPTEAQPLPVPEPPVIGMLLTAGLMGGIFYFRKKRRELAISRRHRATSRAASAEGVTSADGAPAAD